MNFDTPDDQAVIDQAGHWLLSSGIQERGGGVARYFLSDKCWNAPVSTEITGYFASTLVQLFKATGKRQYLEAAVSAAGYLVAAWDSQLSVIPFEPLAGRFGYSYFFDTGIVARGLLAVWRETADPALLRTASKCGRAMRESFFDGRQYGPVIMLPDMTLQPYDPSRWSQSPGCYQLKAGLAWYELFEAEHDARNLECYQQLMAASLAGHNTFLPGADARPLVMDRLHAYLYFLEGLLPVVGDDISSAQVLTTGIGRVGGYLEDICSEFLRADVLAQYLRIRLFAARFNLLPLDRARDEKIARQIREFQSQDADSHLAGGFWFGRKDKVMVPFMNPWVTGFCCQGLTMWNNAGDLAADWRTLI